MCHASIIGPARRIRKNEGNTLLPKTSEEAQGSVSGPHFFAPVSAIFARTHGKGDTLTMYLTAPVPNEEAAEFIRGKAILGHKEFLSLPPEIRARATTVAGCENFYVIQDILDACATIPEGGDWETTKQEIADKLTPYMSGDDDPDAEFYGLTEPSEKAVAAANRRAETILRMNVGQAYAAAHTAALDENRDVFPYRQYLSMGDGRVRSSHAALNNLVLPADHKFWQDHTPPWEFNCRCTIAGLMDIDVDDIREDEAARGVPPSQSSIPDQEALDLLAEQSVIRRGNEVIDLRTPYDKDGVKGYAWDPRSLKLPRAAVLDRLSDDIRPDWESWAKETTLPETGVTIWDWMA